MTSSAPWDIAVVGCGAMGSIYAALLAAAGNRVIAVDPWTEHVAAINERGLRVVGSRGDQTVELAAFTSAPSRVADLIVVAAKALNVRAAAEACSTLIGENTTVLTIQNGLGSADIAAGILGGERLAVGIAGGFGAQLVAPGHVIHNAMKLVRIGAYSTLSPERLEAVVRCWTAAGFQAEVAHDIPKMQWDKLICNVGFSGPCVVTGGTVGDILDDPVMDAVRARAAREAYDIAIASGIAVDVADPVEHSRRFGESVRGAKPSTLIDHELGRISEIEFINGAVERAALRIGREAPVNATITAFVLQRERRFRR
jgi:2-dehydropantoate 2-reductase